MEFPLAQGADAVGVSGNGAFIVVGEQEMQSVYAAGHAIPLPINGPNDGPPRYHFPAAIFNSNALGPAFPEQATTIPDSVIDPRLLGTQGTPPPLTIHTGEGNTLIPSSNRPITPISPIFPTARSHAPRIDDELTVIFTSALALTLASSPTQQETMSASNDAPGEASVIGPRGHHANPPAELRHGRKTADALALAEADRYAVSGKRQRRPRG